MAAAGGGAVVDSDGEADKESEEEQEAEGAPPQQPQQEDEDEDDDSNECAICLNELVLGRGEQEVAWLPCMHAFHAGCFGPWKDSRLTKGLRVECPICRMSIT